MNKMNEFVPAGRLHAWDYGIPLFQLAAFMHGITVSLCSSWPPSSMGLRYPFVPAGRFHPWDYGIPLFQLN